MLLLRLYILAGCVAVSGGSFGIMSLNIALEALDYSYAARCTTRGIFEALFIVAAVTIGAKTVYRIVERQVLRDLRETWHATHAGDDADTRE